MVLHTRNMTFKKPIRTPYIWYQKWRQYGCPPCSGALINSALSFGTRGLDDSVKTYVPVLPPKDTSYIYIRKTKYFVTCGISYSVTKYVFQLKVSMVQISTFWCLVINVDNVKHYIAFFCVGKTYLYYFQWIYRHLTLRKKGDISTPKLRRGDNFVLAIYCYLHVTIKILYNVVISPLFFMSGNLTLLDALVYTLTLNYKMN